jgi:WhiB family redox-sensing transcriptional regulator
MTATMPETRTGIAHQITDPKTGFTTEIAQQHDDEAPWALPWAASGACRHSGLDPDIWFPISTAPDAAELPKAICGVCSVRQLCLASALQSSSTVGIWGGTDESERKSMIRRAARRTKKEYSDE